MVSRQQVFIGTDSGATMSKTGAVWADGSTVSTKLQQRPTSSEQGPEAMVGGWIDGITAYLEQNGLTWEQVSGVGLAIPGPYQRYGVLGRSANMPASFDGFDVHAAYSSALAAKAGRTVPLIVGNDGNYGGVGEAQRVRGEGEGSVLMLAPGSGLGCAFVDRDGLPLDGDTLAGMEASHMAAPLQVLDAPAYPCGCGRTWGCIEVYTTLSGIPHLLAARLPRHPDHALARSSEPMKEKALSLRGLAQKGDPLAVEIFDFQARAMGLLVANLVMALDPKFVVISGGLMDPESTTEAFRERYLGLVRDTAMPYLWPQQRDQIRISAATLGDLSQAIGAGLVALYRSRAPQRA